MNDEKETASGLVVSGNRSLVRSSTQLVRRGLESLAGPDAAAVVVRAQADSYELLDDELIDDIIIRGYELYRDEARPLFKEWAQRLREELDLGPEADIHLKNVWALFTGGLAEPLTLKSSEAYFNRGQARLRYRDNDGAKDDFTKAIEINPRFGEAYYNRGRAKEENGDYEGAIADYTRALEIDPRYAKACNSRGIAKSHRGDPDGAIEDYTKAIEIDPRYASPFNNRGVEKKKKGDLDSAIADYTRAIEIDPRDAAVYNNRGIAKWNKGDLDGSRADFAKASEIDPLGYGPNV